ncbi:MAG: 30S ribosomal protein S17 [Thermoplasmata archaeon]
MAKKKSRDIGIDVPLPKKGCEDMHCPFHGNLPVRGQILEGVVKSDKMANTIVVEREYLRLIPKYERYEKRTRKYQAHSPPCLEIKRGDEVAIMECRPLSKTITYVAIEKKGG